MKTLLLAAGKGERFFPFSDFRPKPMFPICNRPLLAWTVERVVAAGLTDIGIVIGHRGGRVRNYFGSGSRFGCTITYIEQHEPRGTAHAAALATEFIGSDDALILHGDIFIGPNVIQQILTAFGIDCDGGVAGVVQMANLEGHTRADVTPSGILSSYTDRPRAGSGLALMGIYALKNSVIPDLKNANDDLRSFMTWALEGAKDYPRKAR